MTSAMLDLELAGMMALGAVCWRRAKSSPIVAIGLIVVAFGFIIGWSACDAIVCPEGQTYRSIYTATVTVPCALNVTVGPEVVTYSTTCGTAPQFYLTNGCVLIPPPPVNPFRKSGPAERPD